MKFITAASFALGAAVATAQQYAGDVISAYLPTIENAEVAFFKIPNPSKAGKNNNLTLINYYSHGTDGNRIVESKIQRAVIVIHGLLRDPFNYENDMLNALATVTDGNINRDTVAVMAPYFPNGDDKGFAYPFTEGLSGGKGSTTNALVWQGSQWSGGVDNHYPHDSKHTSSFYVLDTLVKYFDDTTLFPNVKEIVLVGHSLGGQMLQRYAALGDQLETNSPVTLWVGNPNSYAWLSTDRPLTTIDCPDYDDYREGFTNVTEYGVTYAEDLVAEGLDAIKANYQSKRIAYARGLYDHGDDTQSCPANTTGLDRGERLFFFLKEFPATCPSMTDRSCDTVDLIPASHDNGQMYKSDAGIARLFTDNFYGDGARAYDFGYPRLQSGDDPFPNPALVSTPGVTNYNTYSGGFTYQGCWANQWPKTPLTLATLLYDLDTNTIENCVNGCVAGGYAVAGVQNSTQCYCGSVMNSESAVLTVDVSCRLTCPGNTGEICGGSDRLSIFSNGYPTFS